MDVIHCQVFDDLLLAAKDTRLGIEVHCLSCSETGPPFLVHNASATHFIYNGNRLFSSRYFKDRLNDLEAKF